MLCGFVLSLNDDALAALEDAAGWMEVQEEVKDWRAENGMNGSVARKDADYGSPPTCLPTGDDCGRLTYVCAGKTTQACGLFIHCARSGSS